MGAHADPVFQKKILRIMKAIFANPFFKKYGRKALVVYLCWCLLKGLLFLFIGLKLFH